VSRERLEGRERDRKAGKWKEREGREKLGGEEDNLHVTLF